MCEVIDFGKYRKERRGTQYKSRRALSKPNGFTSIGVVSAEIVRKLRE